MEKFSGFVKICSKAQISRRRPWWPRTDSSFFLPSLPDFHVARVIVVTGAARFECSDSACRSVIIPALAVDPFVLIS